ncbi:hypothetical protein GSI_04071 [Ganoderma sinense ZZ0214-1]|uniref:Ribonuclease H1 N-terminal domain-containing protein n=1 Tax=Ganoderma sinense ZZ0214-1 TaxID=1077348 RepID=A0A2G8SIR6_9APHY|nr:hypothetical protein GSI_04071 [Ganoderma sinense ZZ0214-1]
MPIVAENPATTHSEGGYLNTPRSCLATAESLMSHYISASFPKSRGPQRDIDGVPDMQTLSLGGSDGTGPGASGLPQRKTASPAEKIFLVSQTVVHIDLYAAETPLEGGARLLSQVPAAGTRASDGSADIPASCHVPRPIVTQGEPTMGPPGVASGSPDTCAVGQSVKPEEDPGAAATQSPQLQSGPIDRAASPNPVGNEDDEHIAPQNPRHKGKWYVVTKGRRVGVWTSWTQMSPYVTGVQANCHQSFASREEALKRYCGAKERGLVAVIKK